MRHCAAFHSRQQRGDVPLAKCIAALNKLVQTCTFDTFPVPGVAPDAKMLKLESTAPGRRRRQQCVQNCLRCGVKYAEDPRATNIPFVRHPLPLSAVSNRKDSVGEASNPLLKVWGNKPHGKGLLLR